MLLSFYFFVFNKNKDAVFKMAGIPDKVSEVEFLYRFSLGMWSSCIAKAKSVGY